MFDVKKAVYQNLSASMKKMPNWSIQLLVELLKKLFHEETFKAIHKKNHHLSGIRFVDSMLESLNVTYTVKPNELKNIPSTGKLIVVANHVTGASDALSLAQVISSKRENKKVKFIVNGMIMGITQIAPIMIPVDNISGTMSKKSFLAIEEALENEEVVIIFPAGIVGRWGIKGIRDSAWKASFLKIAQRTKTSILPIRIETRNSFSFYFLSVFLPLKITALLLPREFALTSKRKPIHLNIGNVIPISSFADRNIRKEVYIKKFYAHLYTLGTGKSPLFQTEVTIGEGNDRKQLLQEVLNAQFLGHTNNGKRIILAESDHSPFLISELGRVREMSFRAIGGGTGKERDNDAYDNYYKHLILWDEHDLEIVGAYRIGECQSIIPSKGKEGLYTSNLCDFSEHFTDYCHNSVEMGRSFIQPKYWGSRALDNLLQAVIVYLAHNPHIQYTYGVITINADTPPKASAALVYFYSLHFSCPTKMMTAKQPYVMKEEDRKEFTILFDHLDYKAGFIVLKKYLKELGTVVPTLFKSYIEIYQEGAVRYFDFSVNEKLFGVVEGFMISDNYKLKKSVQDRYLKNFYQNRTTDVLTNFYNKSQFNAQVNSITKHQRRTDINFVLAMIKVEKTEQVEDRILVKVADTLKESLRNSDIIAKWDEDEFILVLKNVSYDESLKILSKLRDTIINVKCSFAATPYRAPEDIGDTFLRVKDALNSTLSSKDEDIVIHD